MAQSYPIWHDITSCIYKASKSYGAKDTSEDNILVGSSAKNSHQFAKVLTTRRFENHEGLGDVVVFRISIDKVIIKEMYFTDVKGRPTDLIKTTWMPDA